MKGGQSGGSGGQSGMPSWLGMAQNYFGGGQGGGGAPPWWGGGGVMQPSAYAQGGALNGADPYGGSGSAYPTYTGPPRDQPLGAPPAPPPGASAPMPVGNPATPIGSPTTGAFMPPAQGGLLGGDANMAGQNNFAGLFSGWHNRGYGIPGQTAPGQMPSTGNPVAAPQSGVGYMPLAPQSPYGSLAGLLGGWM
jgi:hypothetical protein